MDKTINIDGRIFELVVVQRDGVSAVYRSGNEYLRIGEKEKIKRDLDFHRKMEKFRFPVTPIIDEGEIETRAYFIEKSLGTKRLRDLFEEDTAKFGVVGDNNFDDFLKITKRFAEAQIKASVNSKNFEEFASGIHLDVLEGELGDKAEAIERRFKEAAEKLSIFPFVVTHGDLNPSNMYPEGVIDLEDSFHAPFGYDLVSSIVTIEYVPIGKDFEFYAKYNFTPEQKKKYFTLLDEIAVQNNLPLVSNYAPEFEFCRAVWLTVRMGEWPKIQKFRYGLFTKKFL